MGQLAQEPLKLGHEVVRGDDDGAPGLVHGVQDAVLPQVGVHRTHVDVLRGVLILMTMINAWLLES